MTACNPSCKQLLPAAKAPVSQHRLDKMQNAQSAQACGKLVTEKREPDARERIR